MNFPTIGRRLALVGRGAIKTIAALAAFVLISTAVLGWLGDYWWPLELFTHFRVVYLGLGVAMALLAILVSWGWAAVVVVATLPHLFVVLEPGLTSPNAYAATPPAGPSQPSTRPQKLRILVFNVAFINHRTDALLTLIEREKPDVIILQEFFGHWPKILPDLASEYPHRALGYLSRSESAILSRYPIKSSAVLAPRRLLFSPLRADIDVNGKMVRVLSLHTSLPLTRYGYQKQNEYLALLADQARRSKGPTIVAGDFNLTHWTARLSRFAKASGLRRVAPTGLFPMTRYQPGLGLAMPFFGLPIDHVFVKGPIRRTAARIGKDIGSDHRPLIVDLEIFPNGANRASR